NRSLWQQMGLEHQVAAVFKESIPDLPVGFSLGDQISDFFAGCVRAAAAIGIATGKGVELPGTNVFLDAANAVDAGKEPFHAFFGRARAADVGRIWRLVDVEWGWRHFHAETLPRLEFG